MSDGNPADNPRRAPYAGWTPERRGDGKTVYSPPGASVRELCDLYGPPPWELSLPRMDALPEECLGMVGAVVYGGARFVREDIQGGNS